MVSIPSLRNRLAGRFVNSQEVAQTISLSMVSNIPLILKGKGGYGKTESILEAMKVVDGWKWGMLEATPETTASDFLGGAVAKTEKFEKYDITRASYDVQRSLLTKDAFFIEEMMDASFNALSALKAIITNKGATVNDEWVPSNLKWLVAATNVDPVTFLQSLPPTHQNSYDALLQRFLVVNQEWKTHTANDYKQLITFVPTDSEDNFSLDDLEAYRQLREQVIVTKDVAELISELAARSTEQGSVVSPRSFMWALNLIKSSAVLNNRDRTHQDDIHVVQYVTSFDPLLMDGLKEEIERKRKLSIAMDKLAEYEGKLSQLEEHLRKNPKSLHPHFLALSVAQSIDAMLDNLGKELHYDDSMSQQVSKFRDKAYNLRETSEIEAKKHFNAYQLI